MDENEINLINYSAGLQYHSLWREFSDVKNAADRRTLLRCCASSEI